MTQSTTISKINIPNGSKFNCKRAIELANLIQRANDQYDCHEAKQNWQPEVRRKLIGSTDLVQNLDAPNPGQVEYDLLAIFKFTEVTALLFRETVPFGFIAQRPLEDGTIGIFVVFRGTREAAEWIDNFNADQFFFLNDQNLGKVSHGFKKIYSEVRPDDQGQQILSIEQTVFTTLHKLPKQDSNIKYQVFVTGHSLGGALATMATLHIAKKTQFTQPILYSFASPRTGDPNFAKHFNDLQQCYRIANSEDIVPTVPPATGKLIGAEMLNQNLSLAQRKSQQNRLESLRVIVGFFSGNLSLQQYQHVGEPIYFTTQKESISFNHNLFITYREVLTE